MELGNTLSNICNNGLAAFYKDNIYFVNVYRGEELYKECGKMYSQITSDKVKYVNIKNDVIYYSTLLGEVKSIDINSKNEKIILEGPVESFILYKSYLFYINRLDNYSLYKYDLESLEIMKISSNVCDKINIKDDKIYYIKCSDDLDWYGTGSIYSIDINGRNEKLILDGEVNNMTLYEDYIYYTSGENMYKLYRINLKGEKRELIINSKVGSFNITNNEVYYSNLSDDGKLYKASIDTRIYDKISDDMPENINIAGEYLYFANGYYGYPYRLYKMKLNGEDKQMI